VGDEGKALILASRSGLALVDGLVLREVNSTGVFVVTGRTGHYARAGDSVGVVDLIPLEVPVALLRSLKRVARVKPVIRAVENKHPGIGVVVTGNEIVEGLRRNLAGPIVLEKIKSYDRVPGKLVYSRDDVEEISS
jgi:hypothetical protein